MRTRIYLLVFCCLVVSWLLTLSVSHGQATDEATQLRAMLGEQTKQINSWERTATTILVLNVVVGVLGIVAGGLQKSQNNWCRIATVGVGLSIGAITVINNTAFEVDRHTLHNRAIQGREVLTEIDLMISRGIPEDPERREAWYHDFQTKLHDLLELEKENGPKASLTLDVLPVAFAQPPQKIPPWISKPPEDRSNLYFLGEGNGPSVAKAKEISREDAKDRAARYFSTRFQNALRGRQTSIDLSALSKYLVNSAEEAKTHARYDSTRHSYHYYTLLRLHKDVAATDLKLFGLQQKSVVPQEFYSVVQNGPGLGVAYP